MDDIFRYPRDGELDLMQEEPCGTRVRRLITSIVRAERSRRYRNSSVVWLNWRPFPEIVADRPRRRVKAPIGSRGCTVTAGWLSGSIAPHPSKVAQAGSCASAKHRERMRAWIHEGS
jgi:hypothetical protein